MYKRIIKIFRLFISFLRISKYLKPGIWSFQRNKISRCLGFPFFIVFPHRKNAFLISDEAGFFMGEWSKKVVFVSDSIVVSLYFGRNISKKRLVRVKKYIKEIKLPHCDYLVIDIKKRLNICERLVGGGCNNHINSLNLLLDSAINSTFIKKEITLSGKRVLVSEWLQHGDVSKENIFYSKCGEPKLIDFDTIGYYPCFYDFFRYLFLECCAEEIDAFKKGLFNKKIEAIAAKANEGDDLIFFIRKYLYIFIETTKDYWPSVLTYSNLMGGLISSENI